MSKNSVMKSFLCFAWIVSFQAVMASPVGALELFLSGKKEPAGGIASLALMVDSVSNLAGLKTVLAYDTTCLFFAAAQKTQQTSSLMHIVNDKVAGRLVVVMAGAVGIAGEDIPLLVMSFRLKEGCASIPPDGIRITASQLMSDSLQELPHEVLGIRSPE